MKLHRKRDLNKCGIYCIRNIINNKVYIGKSINIYERIRQHINHLNKNSYNENEHFKRAWFKYGRNNFEYLVLEYIDNTLDDYEQLLENRELYWMKTYNALNSKKGYNIRFDSKTRTKVNSLTKQQLSNSMKKRWGDNYEQMREMTRKIRRDMSEETTKRMAELVSIGRHKYSFYQIDKKTNEIIKFWERAKLIIDANPNYKRHNIYAVCSGEKPSMYGYKWKKVLKEDIVQS